jgi:hypothetical protein
MQVPPGTYRRQAPSRGTAGTYKEASQSINRDNFVISFSKSHCHEV